MNHRPLVGARKALSAPRIISVLRTTSTALLLVFLWNHTAFAESCGFIYTVSSSSFESIDSPPFDYPFQCLTHFAGINDGGQIVGWTPGVPNHGFVKDGMTFKMLDVPGANFTELIDINNLGQIVGLHGPGGRAFSTDGTTFTSYDYPGALFTYANGINDKGQIVGAYRVEVVVGPNSVQDFDHALVIDGPIITSFDVPGAYSTAATGINNSGQIVGTYTESSGKAHGFLKYRDTLVSFDYPGARSTDALGINDSGQIVGTYFDATNGLHGFIKDGDKFTSLDFPDATFTAAYGINNLGQIVGDYEPRPAPPGVPEPGTIVFLCCGLLAIGLTQGAGILSRCSRSVCGQPRCG
jgi:probable HAF family extracellular repeat protein